MILGPPIQNRVFGGGRPGTCFPARLCRCIVNPLCLLNESRRIRGSPGSLGPSGFSGDRVTSGCKASGGIPIPPKTPKSREIPNCFGVDDFYFTSTGTVASASLQASRCMLNAGERPCLCVSCPPSTDSWPEMLRHMSEGLNNGPLGFGVPRGQILRPGP